MNSYGKKKIHEDDDFQDDDFHVRVIQSVTNLVTYHSRGLQGTDVRIPYEAAASKTLLGRVSNLWNKMMSPSGTENIQSERIYTDFLMRFYDIISDSKTLFFPEEHTRRLFRFIHDNRIVSAKFVADVAGIEKLETKKSARIALRRLVQGGVLVRYSTEILCEKITNPFANLRRTELYGFGGQGADAYDNIINFYSIKTEDAHKDEKFKAGVKRNKAELITMEEKTSLTQGQLGVNIKNLERKIQSYKNHKKTRLRAQVPQLEQELEGMRVRFQERIR